MNNRKLLFILLLLVMVALIVAGCGKTNKLPSTGADPETIEGTWQILWEREIESGINKDHTDEFPIPIEKDKRLAGLTYMLQLYYQYHNGNFSLIGHLDFNENSLGLDKVLLKRFEGYEGTYSVTGDILTLSINNEDGVLETMEFTFSINGNKMSTSTTIVKGTDTVELSAEFIKVSNTVVDGAIDYNDFVKMITEDSD